MSGWEIFLGVLLGLIVNEACDLSPWAARKIVQWSARVRYTNPERAKTREIELMSLIEERPGKLFKLCTALGFAITAATSRAFHISQENKLTILVIWYSVKIIWEMLRLRLDRDRLPPEELEELAYGLEVTCARYRLIKYATKLLFPIKIKEITREEQKARLLNMAQPKT